MTDETNAKMYKIANNLNQLTKDKVKKFPPDKGYAKVHQIRPGCSIWTHHLEDDRLIIDLMITEKARQKFDKIATKSVDVFKNFFPDKVAFEEWHHPIDGHNAERYFVNISEDAIEEVLKILHQLRDKFSNL
jgi:hypothetical protein